jgi:hypothetical protein
VTGTSHATGASNPYGGRAGHADVRRAPQACHGLVVEILTAGLGEQRRVAIAERQVDQVVHRRAGGSEAA